MFGDIDTYCINADINSCDNLMLVLEFVLSDACSNEQNTKEKTEVLNIERIGNLMEHVVNDGIHSSEICKNIASGEDLVGTVVKKARQVVESVSQFDDLDFFLNPLEATSVKNKKSADQILEMDSSLPVVSANNPIETYDASIKQQQSLENEINLRGDFHSTSKLNESSKNLEGPLHSTHIKGKNSMGSLEATYEVPQLPSTMDPKKVNTNTPSLSPVIIIVNTQNGEAEMIISRRSTYQKMLAMEKEGVQVIERDLNLPVDVIISAAVCLVLYDNNNIERRQILQMIFEGEVGFLGGIMESSDELYAAAASLGIDLQLFYSYSAETTDEIILSCITHAAKRTRGLYPKMPETETLAESFLSKFTSLNPLSAHAILSSVGTLIEFFEMSHQQRKSNDVLWDPPKSVDSHGFWNFEAGEISDDIGKSNAAFDEIYLRKNQTPDVRMMLNRPSLTETMFGRSNKVRMPIVDKLGKYTNEGEIIDINDDAMAGEDFSFLHPEKVSSEWFSLPSFSKAAEINSDLNSWIPTKDNGETLSEGFILNSKADLMNNITPFKEKDPCYGRTPLSKAIFSDQPQKGSPWTIDFLNRIKEKSRIRHQSMPNFSSGPCFGYSGNLSKLRKRKSPSILDFYRYNNSSTEKSTGHKGQKGPIQAPRSSKAVKTTPSSSQTWTPVDKRAKRKLTFATNGSKGQSKLIWSDKVIKL
ncbi:hypothetical protein R6Q59_019779 [Mikania micrantha]